MKLVAERVAGAVRRAGLPVWKTRKIPLYGNPPIVSFTFDDFPRSALTIGGAILEGYNARGTYYTAMGLMGISNHEGEHFCAEDLGDLLGRGHELGSHTYSHISAKDRAVFRDDAVRGEAEIADIRRRSAPATSRPGTSARPASKRANPEMTLSGSGNFAYPFGDVTFASKGAVGLHMRSCRGIRGGVMAGSADLNLLLANQLYDLSFDLGRIEALIQENQRRRGWLIFYTHDVRENPSEYGCTPAQFEASVRAASGSGAKVLTIEQALDTLQQRSETGITE